MIRRFQSLALAVSDIRPPPTDCSTPSRRGSGRPALGETRQAVLGQRLPDRCVIDVLVIGGPDPRIRVEATEPDGSQLGVVRMFRPHVGAALGAKDLPVTIRGFPDPEQLLALD